MSMTPTELSEQPVDFGPLPADWTLEPLRKYLTRRRSVVGSNSRVHTLLSLTLRGVIVRDLSQMKGKFPASFDSYQEVKPGDFVFCLFDVEETPRTVGCARGGGMITGAYDVFACNNPLVREFLLRLLTVQDDQKRFAPLYRGLRKTIPKGSLLALRVPMPPSTDLPLIVRYLDHAEMRIAKAIAGKNELLKHLLDARRAKIATEILGERASVKLHPNLPFETPTHWEIAPFWSVAPEVSISGHAEKELLSVYLDRGVIRYSESGGQVHKPSLDLSAYQLVKPNDLVLNNQQAWRGSVGVSRYEGIISPAYVVCRLDERFEREFANFLFRSPALVCQFELASRGVGSIQRQLHRQSLRVLRVPVPPRAEQARIASKLLAETRGLDAAADSLRQEIAFLKEYRVRLISDVVTGKLDVRAEAASLPDVDPSELAAVLAGGATSTDEEEGADGDE